MAVSIIHRATGVGMALAGASLFVWWLTAAAGGAESYAVFTRYVIDPTGAGVLASITVIMARVVAIGLSWAFFQHMFSGIRHLVLDTGAGYELRTNRRGAMATMVGSALVTVLVWGWVFLGSGS